jgi:hypothetical protein
MRSLKHFWYCFCGSLQAEILLDYTGFTEDSINHVARVMSEKICARPGPSSRRRPLDAVRRKYESDRYHNASLAFDDPDPSHLN